MFMLEVVMPIIVVIFILSIGGFFVWYGIRQNKSIIERARKIDPSVNTITEAHYVLQKDIARNFGNDKK